MISQINFGKRYAVESEIFMLGDAAGLIVPLCGNGMSMALNSAHEFSHLLDDYFLNRCSRTQLKKRYSNWWSNEFNLRLGIGRNLQRLFYFPALVNPTLNFLNKFPRLTDRIISLTHGKNIL